jgi:hypothetical protein
MTCQSVRKRRVDLLRIILRRGANRGQITCAQRLIRTAMAAVVHLRARVIVLRSVLTLALPCAYQPRGKRRIRNR